MYHLFPVHAFLTINMLASVWTMQLIVIATFYTEPHKQVCNAYGHESLCALHPIPAFLSRSCSRHGHKCQVLHTQVPVNTRWRLPNHHCVYLKVPWEPPYVLCHPHRFLTSNCHFLSSCFYSLCPVHLQLVGIVLCRCQKASEAFRAYVSFLTHLFSVFDPWFFKYLY